MRAPYPPSLPWPPPPPAPPPLLGLSASPPSLVPAFAGFHRDANGAVRWAAGHRHRWLSPGLRDLSGPGARAGPAKPLASWRNERCCTLDTRPGSTLCVQLVRAAPCTRYGIGPRARSALVRGSRADPRATPLRRLSARWASRADEAGWTSGLTERERPQCPHFSGSLLGRSPINGTRGGAGVRRLGALGGRAAPGSRTRG